MKSLVTDKNDQWTSCELRRLVKLIHRRSLQELQLDYFDEEFTEHLSDKEQNPSVLSPYK